MGPETFQVYKVVKQIGDDGLPHHLLQVDVENAETKIHIVRIFIPINDIKQLFFEQKI